MTLPKSIVIGGRKVRLQIVADLEDHGQFIYDDLLIRIDKDLLRKPREFYETLRHEVVEAALLIGGAGWQETYDQEPVARALDNIFWPTWERLDRRLRVALKLKI
jgi:hypothetical protein